MSSIAFDIQNIARRIDTLDAKGPISRGLQSALAMSYAINSLLREIQNPDPVTGVITSGEFLLCEEYVEADRSAFETAVTSAQTATTALLAALQTTVKSSPIA